MRSSGTSRTARSRWPRCSRLLRSTDRIAVTAAGDGATVSYDAEVRLRGPLRLLDPVLDRGFRTVGDRAAAGLARALAR